ncbi:hypothetical protein MXD62_19570 [Frankia sp. Mgl5]|uniref:hypothetical protein n=1 Tax=Frankia sp. Mgl5 TaxID=2933793 RepID=UPI00200E69F5|nr:hypothetical protein [Frankia sp. Mgl5]MCK9929352.1 hypothetical protein [Frankia sp. Mgl5]
MPEHTLAVTLTAPTDEALGAVDAQVQAALAWGICTTPGATVTVACDCDQTALVAESSTGELRTGVGLFGTAVYLAAAGIVLVAIARGAGIL